jgi:phospholipid/cholesterol/gamma-HCH transport system substrate-binding protein
VITRRTLINIAVFMGLALMLVYLGATTLVFQKGGGPVIGADFSDAAGLSARNDVTMRGVPVGAVRTVTLTPTGLAHVTVVVQPGIEVPQGSKATIMRRSPIGDLVLDIQPGRGPPMASGSTIPEKDTITPPDPEKTIQALAQVLGAVPSQDLSSLVHTLAVALNGRGRDLAALSVAGAQIPTRLLQIESQLRSLIVNGPSVTGVLAANAHSLADDIAQTAELAQILDTERNNLVSLSRNGASFATVANDIISQQKANLACLIHDFGDLNATLAEPQNLNNLESTLELNHFFFDAVNMLVQPGTDRLSWFRVQLIPPQSIQGRAYQPHRPPPDVYTGNSCQSIYGTGVGPGTQPGPAWLAPGSTLHPGQ